jgi:hypothetical protein
MDLLATRDGPQWSVQLDTSRSGLSPPWSYTAPLEGTPVQASG